MTTVRSLSPHSLTGGWKINAGTERQAHKLGGSVTYGPLAVATLGRGCRVRVVCRVGKAAAADPFLSSLRTAGTIDLSGVLAQPSSPLLVVMSE
jgi:hypothetical protein